MNVLMYPLGPDDDFPEEFCAIRQGSGEHRFYTPVDESESWTLYHALDENAKLREERNHWHVEQVHAYSNWEDAHKRATELELENAKLKQELEAVGTASYLYGRSDLKSENAKLRELIDELYPLADYGAMDASELNATLGQGTCHEVMIDRFFRGCGECGYMWEYMYSIGKRVRPNYCPNCGRRIVDPTTNAVDAEVDDG